MTPRCSSGSTELVLEALNLALTQRRPTNVIHHSDQGCQYTSFAFGRRCEAMGVRPSMGSVGDAYDNAMCESFFATLECELIDRGSFKTQADARMAVFEFLEGWAAERSPGCPKGEALGLDVSYFRAGVRGRQGRHTVRLPPAPFYATVDPTLPARASLLVTAAEDEEGGSSRTSDPPRAGRFPLTGGAE